MRSLGNYHFTRSNFTECIDAFSLALKLNPLFENIWFIMGCAAMQIQNWPVAEHAFSRVVAITFDNAEAWNNLGSVYLRQHQKEPAFRAFQNALKEKHDDYRIWRNFFWTSLDIHRYAESMEAILTLVELQGASFLDEQDDASFHLLVHAILDLENGQLASKMLTVFTRVTEVVTHRERIWAAYTDLLLGLAKCEEAFQTSLKAYRAVSIRYPTIVDNSAFAAVAACGLNVAHVYGVIKGKDQATSSMFSQTKSLLRTLTGRTRRVFEDHEAFTELENALEELEE
jgi:tetratricopeptide (TPR) repeat protein